MSNYKILVIEDNDEMRENISELLELGDYDVEVAENGRLGVKKALDYLPDLIICDIMMPEMDGYETLHLISRNQKTMSIPFIFLTAKAEKEDFRKGMEMGADDYLIKPFDHISLLNTVERRLKKHIALVKKRESGPEQFLRNSDISTLFDQHHAVKHYAKKDFLFREGDFAHYVFLIKTGEVKTYKINEDGKEYIHAVKRQNEFIGQNAVITDTNYTAFAQALEETEALLIPRLEFQKLILNNREVSTQFIKLIARDVIEKETELLHLAYDTVRKRTVDALIEVSNDLTKEEIHISRDDLSNMVGTATESVIRVLSELKKDQIISINQGIIKVNDANKLKGVKF